MFSKKNNVYGQIPRDLIKLHVQKIKTLYFAQIKDYLKLQDVIDNRIKPLSIT